MKSFIISEEEKKRILNMHETMTKNHYLMEQEESEAVTCLKTLGYVVEKTSNQDYKLYMRKYNDAEKRTYDYIASTDNLKFIRGFVGVGTNKGLYSNIVLKQFDCERLKKEMTKK